MTNPIEVEALLREADDYLAGSQHRPTQMVRKFREALAAELAHSSEMSQEARQAEQRLAAAPHDSGCWMASGRNGYSCTCWKSRTTA